MKVIFYFLLSLSVGAIAAPVNSTKNFFKDKTKIENPFNLRDPFKSPVMKSEIKSINPNFKVLEKGKYSNISEASLDELTISNVKVVGVLIGKERRAMISAGESKSVIILKEGMKIGPEKVELKAILPGGIVLVEKMVNVYGEEEFLETVIPISK